MFILEQKANRKTLIEVHYRWIIQHALQDTLRIGLKVGKVKALASAKIPSCPFIVTATSYEIPYPHPNREHHVWRTVCFHVLYIFFYFHHTGGVSKTAH